MRRKRILIGKNINIRLATIDDIDQLINLRLLQQHEDWGSDYTDVNNDFYKRTLNSLFDFLCCDNIQQQKGVIFIAEKGNKIIATCGLQKISMLPQCNDNGNYGFIFNVFTIKEFRNQGIQSSLIERTLIYANEIGITEIKLETDNKIAIKLYKKYGFKHDKISMVKSIYS